MVRIMVDEEDRLWLEDSDTKHEIDLYFRNENDLEIEVDNNSEATSIHLRKESAEKIRQFLNKYLDRGISIKED